MTKKYSILQKKLQDLESELNDVFSLPAETPCHRLISDGIQQRFVFLKNLLSAEMASTHPTKPHHLHHISHRLTELETAFHDWDDFRTSALNHIDTSSSCSCTNSCFNDDDDGGDEDGLDSHVDEDLPEVFYDGVIGEKVVPEEAVKVVEPAMKGVRREMGRVWCGGVMVGVVLMGLVMVRYCGCFDYYVEPEFFLTPT